MVYYNQENFKVFTDSYNILNGQLSAQLNLNKSVNVIKHESLDSHNRLEILRGSFATTWATDIEYYEGEIVSFTTDPGLPSEITKNYAVKVGQVALNKIPDAEPLYWEEVTFDDYFVPISSAVMANYLAKTNTIPYTPTDDYNPATKKYVDDMTNQMYIGGNPANGVNYLTLDNTIAYTPTDDYNPATKKYVVDSITTGINNGTIAVNQADNADKLGLRDASDYITLHREFIGNYQGMGVKNGPAATDINTTDWIRTTANGIIPYNQDKEANIGDEQWQFKAMYAVNFSGNLNSLYETDTNYAVGTVLEIGQSTEVTKYNGGVLAGVVSIEASGTNITVATSGRTTVNISGSATRGQYINAYSNGLGIASSTKTDNTIGVCITAGTGSCEVKI